MFISKEIIHQTLAFVAVFFNEMSLGLGYGWISPTLRQHQDPNGEIYFNMEQSSWIASIHEFGRAFGPLFTGLILDRYGRRKVLIATTIMFFLEWPFMIFTRNILIICCIRFVFGIATGMNDVCSTIYVGENSLPKYRGIFGSVSLAAYYGAELVEFILAAYLPYHIVASTNAVLTFLALSGIFTIVESPQYLISQGKNEKAEKNFHWLRGINENQEGFVKLQQVIQKESANKLTFKKLVTTPLYCKRVCLVLVFCGLVTLSGYSAVNSFVSIAFSESSIFSPNQFTILYGLLQFIAAGTSPFFIEKFNRRTILMVSFLFSATVHGCSAVLFYVNDIVPVPYFSYLIFSTITLYSMTFALGIHPTYFAIRGELFPQNVKSLGGSVTILAQSLLGFLSTKLFLYISSMFGIYMNFVLFLLVSIFSLVYVYFLLPETRGKTLAEIQESFESKITQKF